MANDMQRVGGRSGNGTVIANSIHFLVRTDVDMQQCFGTRFGVFLLGKHNPACISVSVPTVRFHLKHIYEKLHVRSRLEAVLKFNRGQEGNS